MRSKHVRFIALITLAALMLTAGSLTARGRPGGGDEGVGNNLATPLIFAEGIGLLGLPVSNSDGTPNYAATGLRPTATEGITVTTLPFKQLTGTPTITNGVELWLQRTESTWQPEWRDGKAAPVPATVKWGDNLLSRSFSDTQVMRIEVGLTDLLDDTTGEPVTLPEQQMDGFNMFYVSGEGSTELWGTDGNTSPMNAGIYSICPRLTITPLSGTEQNGDPGVPVGAPIYDQAVYESFGADGPGYYSAEVNVSGNTVYGYVWQLNRFPNLPDLSAAGWWRLTFQLDPVATYTVTPEEGGTPTTYTVACNTQLKNLAPAVEEETDKAAPAAEPVPNVPKLDAANNRTTLDIYITGSEVRRPPITTFLPLIYK